MTDSEPSEAAQQFLIQLFEQTKGDGSIQVSMYDIGELLGMDRDTASKVAQELMGPLASDNSEYSKLGDEPVLNSGGRQAVGQVVSELKNQTGSLGLDFDTLSELMADLKTLEAQLDSSRPKTAIIRECLRSVLGVMEKTKDSRIPGRIRKLMEG